MQEEKGTEPLKPARAVLARVIRGRAQGCEMRFTDSFLIGRSKENDLQVKDDVVSRQHAKVFFDGELAKKNIPQETYDYVFYIFSATVIYENPRLFGFNFDCPTLSISG
jgi:hypothetical protein